MIFEQNDFHLSQIIILHAQKANSSPSISALSDRSRADLLRWVTINVSTPGPTHINDDCTSKIASTSSGTKLKSGIMKRPKIVLSMMNMVSSRCLYESHRRAVGKRSKAAE